jgi:hypothetical protein
VVATAPICTPSIWNSTPVTATSSAAVAVRAIVPASPLARLRGVASVAVGGVASAPPGPTATLTAALVVVAPFESVARAVRLCAPLLVGVQLSA